MTEHDLFLKLVKKYVDAVETEMKGVRSNRDMEYLHRMRVSLRRLKTVLSDFKEFMPSRDYDPVLLNINKLLRALGSARDVDTKITFLKELVADPRAARYREGLLEIINELSEDRNEIQPKVMKNLARFHQNKVARSALRLKPSLVETGITLDEWAKNRVLMRLEKLFSLEPYVRRPECVKELHEMRIAAKNLRYTLENLQVIYGRRLKPFAYAAMKVQRSLGEVHSFDVWLELMKILADSSGREPSFRRAVGFLRKESDARRSEAYRAFLKLWTGLKRRKTWARLGFFALDRA
jgi:CHAD domain-containing protein